MSENSLKPTFNTRPPAPVRLAAASVGALQRFFQLEAASGIVLVVTGALAFAWANSPWREHYRALWNLHVPLPLPWLTHAPTLAWIINDGLMAIFFFAVGLEIRREAHDGTLSDWRQAALPVTAALGGMLAPAALYLAVVRQPEARVGWGVPMATDIAFALAVFALLGRRVPQALRVLLLGLAVIDDLGAIVVIALFYSSGVAPASLLVAVAGLGAVLLLRRRGVRSKWAYLVPGIVVWGGVGAAGIHPTIAGVALGMLTPVQPLTDPTGTTDSRSPADTLLEWLHPLVAFGIMPLFALANAGVVVSHEALNGTRQGILLGVVIGLILGKPLGVLLASAFALRLGVAVLPEGLTLRHLVVLGVAAGVGFTMALFVAQLAFSEREPLDAARAGVLTASVGAAVATLVFGRMLLKAPSKSDA